MLDVLKGMEVNDTTTDDIKNIVKGFFRKLFGFNLRLAPNWPSDKDFALLIRVDGYNKEVKFFSTVDQQKEYINYLLKKYDYTNHEVFVQVWKFSYRPRHLRDMFVN